MQTTTIMRWDPQGALDWIRRSLKFPAGSMPEDWGDNYMARLGRWFYKHRAGLLSVLVKHGLVTEEVEANAVELPWWRHLPGLGPTLAPGDHIVWRKRRCLGRMVNRMILVPAFGKVEFHAASNLVGVAEIMAALANLEKCELPPPPEPEERP